MLRIAVVGIGAMGCLFASQLAPYARISLLGHWPEQLAALQDGLTLITPSGERRRVNVDVHSSALELPPADIALVVVKSYQTGDAAEEIAHFLKPDGMAVTLQNGVGNDAVLASRLGTRRVILGSTTEGAMLEAPATVRHAGKGETVIQDIADRRAPLLSRFIAVLQSAGFKTTVSQGVHEMIWEKLAVNAAINPLTALLRAPNGALLASDALRALMRDLAAEAAQVARAKGHRLSPEEAADRAEQVASFTRENRSSMLQDVLKGRRTELEAISGEVIREGDRLDVAVPLNSAIYRLLKARLDREAWGRQLDDLPPALQPIFVEAFSKQDGINGSCQID